VLCDIEGFSYEEIAATLGVKAGARCAAGFTAAGLSCARPWSTAGPLRPASHQQAPNQQAPNQDAPHQGLAATRKDAQS